LSNQCIITLTSQVNCTLSGLSPTIREYFYEKFEYEVPGARFSAKVQLGIWNGKISYFKKNGETNINLLKNIVPDLKELGYSIKLVDKRLKSKTNFDPIKEDYFSPLSVPNRPDLPAILRDYQIKSINSLLAKTQGLVIAGTGAGKTMITAALCSVFNHNNLKGIIIVPSTSLVKQTREYLELLKLDIGEFSGKRKDIDHMTVVSTWQALQNTPIIIKQFQMVLADECHLVKGNILQSILGNYGEHIIYRYGLTATLPKEDIHRIAIHNMLGNILYEIPSHELIALGHLAKIEISIIQIEADLNEQYQTYIENCFDKPDSYAKFKNTYFPDYNAEKQYLKSNIGRLNIVADKLIELSLKGKGNTLALVEGIAFGKKLLKIIQAKIDIEHVYFLHGNDEVEIRAEVYSLFENNNNIIVIATVNIASVGIDISRVFNLALIDIGKSFIRVLQSIGRGLRKGQDKQQINVFDICSDLKYARRHLSQRIKFYKEAKYPYQKIK